MWGFVVVVGLVVLVVVGLVVLVVVMLVFHICGEQIGRLGVIRATPPGRDEPSSPLEAETVATTASKSTGSSATTKNTYLRHQTFD